MVSESDNNGKDVSVEVERVRLRSAVDLETVRLEATRKMEEQRIEFTANIESMKIEFKAALDSALELFRSQKTAGQNFMRTAVTLNGGAALAILALVAQLPTTDVGSRGGFARAFLYFSGGAFSVLTAAGITFLGFWIQQWDEDLKWVSRMEYPLQAVGIVMGICSWVCFLLGVYAVVMVWG